MPSQTAALRFSRGPTPAAMQPSSAQHETALKDILFGVSPASVNVHDVPSQTSLRGCAPSPSPTATQAEAEEQETH